MLNFKLRFLYSFFSFPICYFSITNVLYYTSISFVCIISKKQKYIVPIVKLCSKDRVILSRDRISFSRMFLQLWCFSFHLELYWWIDEETLLLVMYEFWLTTWLPVRYKIVYHYNIDSGSRNYVRYIPVYRQSRKQVPVYLYNK